MLSSTGISRWLRLGCLLASLLFASYAVGQYLPRQQIPFDSLEAAFDSLTTEAEIIQMWGRARGTALALSKETNFEASNAYLEKLSSILLQKEVWSAYAHAQIAYGVNFATIGQYERAYRNHYRPARDTLEKYDALSPYLQWLLAASSTQYFAETGRINAALVQLKPFLQPGMQRDVVQAQLGAQREPTLAKIALNRFKTGFFLNLGSVYLYAQVIDSARASFDSAYWYAQQSLSPDSAQNVEWQLTFQQTILENLGLLETEIEHIAAAEAYYQRSTKILTQLNNNPEANPHLNRADLYAKQGKWQKAEVTIRKGMQPDKAPTKLLYHYLNLTTIFFQTQRIDSALLYAHTIQEVEAQRAPFSTSPTQNFPIDSLTLNFRLVTGLIYKARAWTMKALGPASCPTVGTGDPETLAMLDYAHQTHLLLADVVDSLRRVNYFSAEDGGYTLADTVAAALSEGIRVAYLLAQARPEQQTRYWEAALRFSELSKYNVLYYEWRQSTQANSSLVPQTLRDQEALLNDQLRYYQTLIKGQRGEERAKNLAILDSIQSDRRDLLETLRLKYPSYYRLIYQPIDLSIARIREQLLGPNDAILEYHEGPHALYALLLTTEEISWRAICRDQDLTQSLEQLYALLSFSRLDSMEGEDIYSQYARPAAALYQRIFAPEHALLQGQSQRPRYLHVVGDGLLRHFSLNALLTHLPDSVANYDAYHRWPYLLRDSNLVISYANSLTVWIGQQNRLAATDYRGEYLGFGAFYSGKNYQDLPIARQAVKDQRQAEWHGAKVLLGEAHQPLSIADFEGLAPHYQVIHLAMHGSANQESDYRSALAFSDQDLLTVADIRQLRLFADLIVLDACETGLGEVKRGEGVLSLARAFAYAGVPAALVSQYQIDEEAAQMLVSAFLAEIRRGTRKDKAWHTAQLSFLQQSDRNQLPHYWAGLMPVGNMDPLVRQPSRSVPWWGWLLGTVMLGVVAVLIWRMRNS